MSKFSYIHMMIVKLYVALVILIFGFGQLSAHSVDTLKPAANLTQLEKYEIEYQKRIKKKYLYGRYIPVDILDACSELNKLADPMAIDKFKSMPEDSAIVKLHYGLGKWIKHNWGFEQGSRYSDFIKRMGLSYPDDMVQLTLLAWHRQLNEQDLDLKPFVDRLSKMRSDAWEDRKKKNTKIIYSKPKMD